MPSPTQPHDDDLVLVERAARLHGLTRYLVLAGVAAGAIRSRVIGGRPHVSAKDVQQFAAERAARSPRRGEMTAPTAA